MRPKKISLFQIDPNDHECAQMFKCVFDTSHIVEQPIICSEANCQQIMCKDCYLSFGICPNCCSSIDINKAELSSDLMDLLNPIYIQCENKMNGCMVEIDYENYRKHTNNCKFKEIMFQGTPGTPNETPTPKGFLNKNENNLPKSSNCIQKSLEVTRGFYDNKEEKSDVTTGKLFNHQDEEKTMLFNHKDEEKAPILFKINSLAGKNFEQEKKDILYVKIEDNKKVENPINDKIQEFKINDENITKLMITNEEISPLQILHPD